MFDHGKEVVCTTEQTTKEAASRVQSLADRGLTDKEFAVRLQSAADKHANAAKQRK